ncbi:MAG TPA: hypothetical protein VEZ24_03270 [Microvirga sp.]|nr:hypothetical protein [Microvirga sp.]
MILDKKQMAGETPAIVAHPLSEIKEAVRELRGSIPGSALIRLAEQKIEMLERGDGENLEPRHGEREDSARRNS